MSEMPATTNFSNAPGAAVPQPRPAAFVEQPARPSAEEPSALPVGTEATPGDVTAAVSRSRRLKRIAFAATFLICAAAGGDWGYGYWTAGRYLESTDDAYLKADYTTVAPKISGYIADVPVHDNQTVETGQVLARIDDRDFRAALAQADAEVEAAEAAVRNLDAQIALQQSLILQAKATVAATQASLAFASTDADRYATLARSGTGTAQKAEASRAQADQLIAGLQRDQASLAAAKAKIDVLATERDSAVAQTDRAEAASDQARLNLSYATITAPVDGTVGARTLRVGQYVASGTQLMAVVPLHAVYVVANFKETQLAHVRPGQPVRVAVDGFPGVELTGQVDSLSPASGLEFALLPPDNATGNFTKIVQRIPVRISIDNHKLDGLLRSGMSVEPTINTKAAVLADGRSSVSR
ncbi:MULTISPECIES: HlyD family secretion protein [unclassified Mesorhizobium]|uniref:HlyD family secretion protein n=1 Tax=unclassified Mesorhizobium TaxID=325217 RepID=UPI00112A5067|nr:MULTISPECIES: HlyD family secretion protein [unclassified Mesorhizobium]TPJ45955.1 HlyD family secretion protein [Mesorhizobium sp. B2-6-6]MCA0008442.1 HlyD family secretion protein [Mesorhizobium sp. B264B1B]MCA0021936.1 HlyD family secretion protein [Mesorhizobium sp. B264B1A]MCA0026361.1 HlyD family secretion protein [Mesorhizobium sp. B263B1A]MCA0056765.1 HlyD family secretion protein [Mesorhizobium sp. B261B1A]